MKRLYFVTGPPRVGKTTAIEKVIKKLSESGLRVGGMMTSEIREGSNRVGFALKDISTGRSGVLAHTNIATGPRIGKYRINQDDLVHLGAEAILTSRDQADVVVVDEIGPMELTSVKFVEAVENVVVSGMVILGTIHYKASHPLIDQIKEDPNTELFTLSYSNRDSAPKLIAERITNSFSQEFRSSTE